MKTTFGLHLKKSYLCEVSDPLAVPAGIGLNDDLIAVEVPVSFFLKGGSRREVVHSLVKWKCLRLQQLGIRKGSGILTDMRAIRSGEEPTPARRLRGPVGLGRTHCSVRPDLFFPKGEVYKVYNALKSTSKRLCAQYRELESVLPKRVTFCTEESLLQHYPHSSPKARERRVIMEEGALFSIGIGGALSNGSATTIALQISTTGVPHRKKEGRAQR